MRSKALAGATQGGADGRTSVDQLGTILIWMQERGGESFLFVTANDVTGLPPELLRKGRFDEIFFVDLPNEEEQPKILQAALAANGRAQHAIGLGAGSARGDGPLGLPFGDQRAVNGRDPPEIDVAAGVRHVAGDAGAERY